MKVIQGDHLSSTLFSLHLEKAVGEAKMAGLLYHISKVRRELQELVELLDKTARKIGL